MANKVFDQACPACGQAHFITMDEKAAWNDRRIEALMSCKCHDGIKAHEMSVCKANIERLFSENCKMLGFKYVPDRAFRKALLKTCQAVYDGDQEKMVVVLPCGDKATIGKKDGRVYVSREMKTAAKL